jgi:hypothetical protein
MSAITVLCVAPRVRSISALSDWIIGSYWPFSLSSADVGRAALELVAESDDSDWHAGAWEFASLDELAEALRQLPESARKQRGIENIQTVGRATRHVAVADFPYQLVQEFIALPRDDRAAIGFVRKVGVFRSDDTRKRADWPVEVKHALEGRAPEGKTFFALPLSEFWSAQDRFRLLAELQGLDDPGAAYEQAEKLGWLDRSQALAMEFRAHLNDVTLGLDSAGDRQTIVKYALSGLYAHLWTQPLRGGALTECSRDACRRVFIPQYPKQVYCTPACANASKQGRHRARVRDAKGPSGADGVK